MISAATRVQGLHLRTWLMLMLAVPVAGGAFANPRAQPEPPSVAAVRPVTDPVEMGAWLSRMVGRYRVEGAIMIVYAPPPSFEPAYPCVTGELMPTDFCTSIKGKGDCIAVGKGPGVQCMFNVAWLDIYETVFPSAEPADSNEPTGVFSLPGGISYLDPAMALYGLDPGKAGLDYLLVDNKGLPEGGPGFITDNKATFKTSCVNAPALFNEMKPAPRNREEGPPRDCDRIIRIVAKPDGKLVQVSIEIMINGEPWTRQDLTLHRETDAAGAAGAKPAPQ